MRTAKREFNHSMEKESDCIYAELTQTELQTQIEKIQNNSVR